MFGVAIGSKCLVLVLLLAAKVWCSSKCLVLLWQQVFSVSIAIGSTCLVLLLAIILASSVWYLVFSMKCLVLVLLLAASVPPRRSPPAVIVIPLQTPAREKVLLMTLHRLSRSSTVLEKMISLPFLNVIDDDGCCAIE